MLTIANVTITSEFAYYVALSTLSWYSPTLNLVFQSGGRGGGVYYSLLCTSAAWALRLRGSVFCKPPRADLTEEAFFRQCAFSLVRFQLSRRVPLSSSIICLAARCQVPGWGEFPFQALHMSGCQVLVPRPIHLLLEVTFSSQMGTLSTRCWCCGQSIFTSGLENGQFRVPDPPVAISVGVTSLKILQCYNQK